MVHTFEIDGNYYLFDVESSSLHVCDSLVSQVVKKINGETYDFFGADEKAVAEIEEEILALKEQGVLYSAKKPEIPIKSNLVKALCLHICHDCNLSCEYCFAGKGKYKGKQEYMSFEVAKRAVDFLLLNSGNRKILEMDFFGGEPLMNLEVVKQTVEYAKEQGEKQGKTFLFTLTTNGVLLNGETARWLNDNMENVVLSLDGRKEVHDGVRKTVNGKGSYEVIIENIKNFVKLRADKSYYVRGTFTAKNLDFSNDVIALADNGLKNISLEPVVLDESDPLYISKEKLPDIKKEYQLLAREYLERRKQGKPLMNFFHFNIDLEGGVCLKKRISACGAGNEYFSVTPNGDIFPCHQFADKPQYKMGNVFVGKINEDIRKIFKEQNLYTKEKCKDCFAKYHCSGGCAANNVAFNGDVNKPYEITCEMMKARMECALHIYSEKKQ
ncbi:MAG: thioether cross-link-forming SCIFF peptide maturase, partial [Clostridia bacterium]|nr:thioether cross-link-forming SCIFF peptide maturase [Clostridia bacterium]